MSPPFAAVLFKRDATLADRLGAVNQYLERIGWEVLPRPKWLAFLGVSMAFTLTKVVWLAPDVAAAPAPRLFTLAHEATHVHRQTSFPGGRFAWLALYLGLHAALLGGALAAVASGSILWAGAVFVLAGAVLGGWFRAREEAIAAAMDRFAKRRASYQPEDISERGKRIGGFHLPYLTAVPPSTVCRWILEAEKELVQTVSIETRPS